MDTTAVTNYLSDLFSEPAHVTTFRAYKDNELVIIEIWDHGPDFHTPEYRYFCMATMEDGRKASGNGGLTVQDALDMVQWNELDLPPASRP